MEINKKKSLLERYGIPIHHLDFKYINDCRDGREMEKIVHILRSNEEGYYPDLTACAEKKLRELKPQSRLFRVEEKIKGREALDPSELKPIYEWNQNIKTTDKKLQKLVRENPSNTGTDSQMPPIRKGGRILQNETGKEKQLNTAATTREQRIKSTDYNKWDKYDAEVEILKVDLAEEREQEELERKNRLNMEKYIKTPLEITEITEEDTKPSRWLNLSDVEKDTLSEDYRLRGNEYFRSKEYDLAIKEYTRAIECCSSCSSCRPATAVAAYNNRALTYFKQQEFLQSIKDSEQALKLEPTNLKANLRLAEANYAFGRRRESYQLYINVLQLDAKNPAALKAIEELRKHFEDLPPPNATRLKIQDESSKNLKNKEQNQTVAKPKPESNSKPASKSINYDLAELVKPNRVVPNRLCKAAENITKNALIPKGNVSEKENKQESSESEFQLRLPGHKEIKPGKKLIEEL